MYAERFLNKAQNFCEEVFKETRFLREKQKKLVLFNNLYTDHIGYDCATHQEYTDILEDLISQEFITEKHTEVINSREITLVKLAKQVCNDYTRGIFEYIEICDQKPDNSQISGFDHVEWYYENNTHKHKKFISDDTYKYFSKQNNLEEFQRPDYSKMLFKVKLEKAVHIISQEGLLWDIALKSNPAGHTIL
jgi:hypothetical protein